jgi:hypothetical protein
MGLEVAPLGQSAVGRHVGSQRERWRQFERKRQAQRISCFEVAKAIAEWKGRPLRE